MFRRLGEALRLPKRYVVEMTKGSTETSVRQKLSNGNVVAEIEVSASEICKISIRTRLATF